MPWAKNHIPSYRRHKATSKAVVVINGRTIYLPGMYGSAESKREYDRLTGEYLVGGRVNIGNDGASVAAVCLGFWNHAQAYYRSPDGKATSQLTTFQNLLKMLREAYGTTPAQDFGPLQLQALRLKMIERNWCRTHINAEVDRVKYVFKWATAQELVPASTYEALRCVSGLRAGRSEARESDPVRPVPQAIIDATMKRLSPTIKALVELQLLTGARPGELLAMRMSELNVGGDVWKYVPSTHKTQHHGHTRVILIGPRGQEVIRPFLKAATDAYLFSPRESEAHRLKELHRDRKTPLSCGNRPGTNKRRYPKRRAGERYTVDSYRRAISRACEAAGVDSWHPHQLRHNSATLLREQFGVDAAKTILGHRTLSTTLLYAEDSIHKATEIMGKIG